MSSENSFQSYYSEGLLEELCEENLKKLLADPENTTLRWNLARTYARLGKHEEAIREYRACIEKNPQPEYLNDLGKSFLNAGLYQESIGSFKEVLGRNCRWPDTLFHLALAHRSLGELDQADFLLQEAVKLNPRYREALNQRAEILEALNRKDEALHAYKMVIALFYSEFQLQEGEDYKYDLSVLLDNPELIDESIRQLQRFVAKNPGYADGHYKLGLALQARGLKNEAMHSFRRALEINPHFETARKCFWKRL
ncbi:MAG: tetratricopeptide repeat protein [Candidatus Ozemobacteraceae bacterium]